MYTSGELRRFLILVHEGGSYVTESQTRIKVYNMQEDYPMNREPSCFFKRGRVFPISPAIGSVLTQVKNDTFYTFHFSSSISIHYKLSVSLKSQAPSRYSDPLHPPLRRHQPLLCPSPQIDTISQFPQRISP